MSNKYGQSGTVPPKFTGYKGRRDREHLTANEITLLTKTARKSGRNGHRDAKLILIAARHALRATEAVLRSFWSCGHEHC